MGAGSSPQGLGRPEVRRARRGGDVPAETGCRANEGSGVPRVRNARQDEQPVGRRRLFRGDADDGDGTNAGAPTVRAWPSPQGVTAVSSTPWRAHSAALSRSSASANTADTAARPLSSAVARRCGPSMTVWARLRRSRARCSASVLEMLRLRGEVTTCRLTRPRRWRPRPAARTPPDHSRPSPPASCGRPRYRQP